MGSWAEVSHMMGIEGVVLGRKELGLWSVLLMAVGYAFAHLLARRLACLVVARLLVEDAILGLRTGNDMLMLMMVWVRISAVEIVTLVHILLNKHVVEVIVVIVVWRVEIVSKDRHASRRLNAVDLAWDMA